MRLPSATTVVFLALACVLAGCRKSPPAEVPAVLGLPPAEVKAMHPEPSTEPPEKVLVDLLRLQYEQINAAGGMPVTVTATGRQLVLKPVLYEAHKIEPCKRVPESVGGGWECSLSVMITLREGDRKPGASAERIFVYWDETVGEWAPGSRPRRKSK